MDLHVAEDLFVCRDGSTRLLAARSHLNGALHFPAPRGSDAALYDIVELGGQGRLWSYTVQRFRPKWPYNGRGDEGAFRPYGVGYVEFDGALIVEGRIVADDLSALQIGQPMFLTTEAYRDDDMGRPVLTYAFTDRCTAEVDA
jgi:uncharacterized OB-fold protein